MRVQARSNVRDLRIDESDHLGISAESEYFVIEISESHYRVIDDKGEPLLYPKALFVVSDRGIPGGEWIFSEYDEGAYFLQPAATAKPGFYEDFFNSDGDIAAARATRDTLVALLQRLAASVTPADRLLIERDLRRLRHVV